MNNVEFGKCIKKYRLIKNLSIEDLSDISPIDTTIIDMCERGHTSMSLEKTVKILNSLNISLSECFQTPSHVQLKNSIIKQICFFDKSDYVYIKKIIKAIIEKQKESDIVE